MASEGFAGQSLEYLLANSFSAQLQAPSDIIAILQNIRTSFYKRRSEIITLRAFQGLQASPSKTTEAKSLQRLDLELFHRA
jgi:hypothetical protein